MKHATILRLSNEPREALTLAEQDYQEAKINLKIHEHLKAFTPQDSVEKFADFIMATNLGLFKHSSKSQQYLISVSTQSSCIKKSFEG